jgi:hypothetical protein
MSVQVETCNFAEALYLFGRGHQVAAVRIECTLPYGHEECALIFEGESAEADQSYYNSHRLEVNLSRLPELFAAVTAVLEKGGPA